MSRRTFFQPVRGFAGAGMALRARNPSPWGLATLNSQSTYRGPRPGPKLARGVWAGSLRATEPRARGKTRGQKRKKSGLCLVTIFLTDLDGTVTQHDGNVLAVDGKSIFDGIFTAVTQHDGKLPAADGFRFLGAASKWPNAKHISST